MEALVYPFLLLGFFHFLADFAWQGDFMAKAKNPKFPIPNVPWIWPMLGHGIIHAGFVWLVTGYIWLAIIECVLHIYIDYKKCFEEINFETDQALHLLCKAGYAIILMLIPSQHWLTIQAWL